MNNFLNPYKHIIWDWNGTLIDDASLSVEIINHLLERRKMPAISPERYQDEFSIPVKEYYRRLGFDFSREPYEKLAEEFITEYEQRKFECSLQPQARSLLEFFRQTGRGQSILTAYRQDKLQELLEYYGIRGGRSPGRGKGGTGKTAASDAAFSSTNTPDDWRYVA
jgi:phosphoglycolate phosphatase